MANSPDISALAAYAGKYERALFSTLVNSFDALNDLTIIPDVKNKLNLTKLRAGNGARPYSVDFQATGSDLQYTGRVLEVEMGKRDIKVEPYKYRSTWMSEVMRPGVNPDDIPFAAYVWSQVMKELAAELNDNTIYFGIDKSDAVAFDSEDTYAKGDLVTFGDKGDYYMANSATTAGDSPSSAAAKWDLVNSRAITIGFAKRIADAITAGDLSPVATGAISDSSSPYDQFQEVWRALPVPYKKAGAILYASWDNVDLMLDDYESKVSKYTGRDVDVITLPKTQGKCTVVRATWMGDSNRLIVTPKYNLLVGTDRVSDMNKINTEPHLRTLDAGIDFVLGTQIRDLKAIVVNDQA